MKLFGLTITRASDSAVSRAEQRALMEDLLDSRAASLRPATAMTPRTAIGVTAVWACVDLLAKLVAELPWGAMIRSGRNRLAATDHPLHALLAIRPNSYQTPIVFRRQAMMHLLLWGNFYAEIQRDRSTGDAIGLYPIHPSEVTVKLDRGVKSYVARGVPMRDEDMFHLIGTSMDGIRGLSPIAIHRSTLALSSSAVEHAEALYHNGARLSGVVNHPGNMSPEAQERFRNSFTQAYTGSANAGKVAILEEGMKFEALSMPFDDLEYVQTRKLQIGEVARIYGIPLHKLAEMDGAKFNNIEQQNISMLIDCIQPICTAWEQEANYKLIHPDERARMYTRFNLAGFLRGDFTSRMAGYAVMRQWGLATINELRALEDWNPIEGGDNPFIGGNAQASATTGQTGEPRPLPSPADSIEDE